MSEKEEKNGEEEEKNGEEEEKYVLAQPEEVFKGEINSIWEVEQEGDKYYRMEVTADVKGVPVTFEYDIKQPLGGKVILPNSKIGWYKKLYGHIPPQIGDKVKVRFSKRNNPYIVLFDNN